MAAGTITVPAVAAQSASSPAKKPIHKHSSSAGATHSSNAPTTTKSTKPAGHKGSGKKRSAKVKGQAAPTSGRISEIQDALAKKGVFTGEPSGKWDESTVEAMKKFQSSNGLNPTGKLDALTLQKLGLGSQTAGRAAPTPPPNSSNRLRNLSSSPSDPNPSN
jgi:peptidoglycan hydrolase-like protein with peptidoglycan-binding domain